MSVVELRNGRLVDWFSGKEVPANWPDTPKQKASERTEAMEMPREIQPVDMFGADLPASWPEPPSTTIQPPAEPRRMIRPIGFDSFECGDDIYFL